MSDKEEIEMINENCSICGNKSGFDKESLKASTYNINGTELVLCCPCEDDFFRTLVSQRVSFERITEILAPFVNKDIIKQVIDEIKGEYWDIDRD